MVGQCANTAYVHRQRQAWQATHPGRTSFEHSSEGFFRAFLGAGDASNRVGWHAEHRHRGSVKIAGMSSRRFAISSLFQSCAASLVLNKLACVPEVKRWG